MKKTHIAVTFRPMRKEDVERILEIEQVSFTAPWSRIAFEGEFQNQFAHYLVALVQGEIVGYGGMWIIIDEAHVTNIAIHPAWRGQGLGASLMEQLMIVAIAGGAERMTLEVRVSNHVAQALYVGMGFRREGIRKQYYSDNGEDALIMWVELME